MEERKEFIAELKKQPLRKADVIFLAAGDGLSRVPYAAELYVKGYAPSIGIVSGDTRIEYGSNTADTLVDELVKLGVPAEALILENTAMNTKEEAERMLQIMDERGFRSVLIVTSPHHQYRAFLTWLSSMKKGGTSVHVINAPAPLSMTEETPYGRREDLLAQEFERIETYRAQGDVASFAEGIEYLKTHV